ncbi:hypothetical protein COCSUDRAFT_60004 [Coccomyxa subellipsoidea C-169]|uniref:Uncharacterized protein n=1 Tax=Coccomyxa subellipsoidea (strain C-169) TaxID=574566 RepID=I0YJX5_COCSC|nr:hypothetical protein COCSUDRAFT_60004 [Coccomyxa subellipsoidea C-169]EIE18694.1 hypothetical protein COCSUDRAFT_60004 [Coccomyxa subellipsoidea C-169]|eukprot:XP_005643238.1 hypothetical protein COCSUDRAFT_60004 [Coccomyxa subellipsoidea C-169]
MGFREVEPAMGGLPTFRWHGDRLLSCQAATSSNSSSNKDSGREELNRKAYEFGRVASKTVKEQAGAVDQKFGVKRKLRNLADDAIRKLPMWKRQYAKFSKTTLGQVVFFAAFFFLCYSGLVWRLLNLVFILWWVAPLFVLPAINHINKKAAEEMAARQQAQQRAAQNPFFGAFNRAQTQQQGTPRAGRAASAGGKSDGPVIDVEYTTVDD